MDKVDASLQANPDGSYVVIVIHEGAGAEGYMGSMAQSGDTFDQWFMSTVADVHGMDPNVPPPPAAEKVI